MEEVRLRAHHLARLLEFASLGNPVLHQYPDKPGIELVRTREMIFAEKCRNATAKIKIVEGIDDLCRACHRRRPICEELKPEVDLIVLRNFGLKAGKSYFVEEILKKLRVSKEFRQVYLNPLGRSGAT